MFPSLNKCKQSSPVQRADSPNIHYSASFKLLIYIVKSRHALEKPFVYVNLVYHCWRSNQFVASAAFLNFAVYKKVSLFSNYLLVMSW